MAAIADYVRGQNKEQPRLVVGYDTRFFSPEFADTAVAVLAARRVSSLRSKNFTPTPTIACEIRRRQADGGLNFTASHNPPEYNGIKFSTPDGAPARGTTEPKFEIRLRAVRPVGLAPGWQAKQPFAAELAFTSGESWTELQPYPRMGRRPDGSRALIYAPKYEPTALDDPRNDPVLDAGLRVLTNERNTQ